MKQRKLSLRALNEYSLLGLCPNEYNGGLGTSTLLGLFNPAILGHCLHPKTVRLAALLVKY